MLYKSLVRPVLEYVTPVWNPWLSKDVLALEEVQLRASGLALGQKRGCGIQRSFKEAEVAYNRKT